MGSISRATLAAMISDGGDGTVIVETDARRVYGDDGRLVSIGPLEGGVAPSSEAQVRDSVLVVGGCEVPLRDVSGEVHTATGYGYAVVADDRGMLAVDLDTCQPVGAASARPRGALLLRAGPALTVVDVSDGVVMEHFALPTLEGAGRGASEALDLLVSRDGPARAVRGRVLDGPGARGLAWPSVVEGGATVEWEGGVVIVRDGDGVERARAAGVTHDLHVASRDGSGWWFKPELSAEDPVCWPQPRPFGTAVVCGDDELGTVPAWTDVARATEDGSVLVTAAGGAVIAWGIARGQLLWRAEGMADALAVGPDWVASRAGHQWTFRDPADGHPLGVLGPDGSMIVDGERAPFDPKQAVGAPWSAPAPSPVTATPPAPFVHLGDVHGCARYLAVMDALAPWPEAWAAARRNAVFACRALPSLPDWAVAPRARRDGWAWPAPEHPQQLVPLGDGSLLVLGARGVGAIGPDGAPRWVHERPHYYASYQVSPEIVVQWVLQRSVGWDPVTGEERWSLLGPVQHDGGGWWWATGFGRPATPLDVARGEPSSSTMYGAAMGWRCGGGGCAGYTPRQDDVVALADGARAALDDEVLVISRGDEILHRRSGVRKLAAAGPDRVIVQDVASGRWELWTVAGRVERLPKADVAAAWGDARWWVRAGMLYATGVAAAAQDPPAPARFELSEPAPVVPPERPLVVGPARAAWSRPEVGASTVAVVHGVPIDREEAQLVGRASAPWRRPFGPIDTSLGEMVIDGVVVDAATGHDVGPVPAGAERLYVRDGAVVAAHREGEVVVIRDGAARWVLPVGVPGSVSALVATDQRTYLGVGHWLMAFEGDAIRWKVRLSRNASRPMVLELRLAGDLLLAKTLHPMPHFAPVWAFDRDTGDVVDVMNLELR
jgi:hypothetical protein